MAHETSWSTFLCSGCVKQTGFSSILDHLVPLFDSSPHPIWVQGARSWKLKQMSWAKRNNQSKAVFSRNGGLQRWILQPFQSQLQSSQGILVWRKHYPMTSTFWKPCHSWWTKPPEQSFYVPTQPPPQQTDQHLEWCLWQPALHEHSSWQLPFSTLGGILWCPSLEIFHFTKHWNPPAWQCSSTL